MGEKYSPQFTGPATLRTVKIDDWQQFQRDRILPLAIMTLCMYVIDGGLTLLVMVGFYVWYLPLLKFTSTDSILALQEYGRTADTGYNCLARYFTR